MDIKQILADHIYWLLDKPTGVRADLSEADLSEADLRGTNLRGADLRGTNLRGADLRGADLRGADLRWADLRGADLSGTNLSVADLSGTNLRWTNLSEADLSVADLRGADLSEADLRGADLRGADLSGTNLSEADLSEADLSEAINCDHAIPETRITPEGTIIGYKKCNSGVIVRLEIPADAARSNATGRKCRAEFVRVLDVYGADVGITDTHGPRTEYHPGEVVRADSWDPDWKNECSGGIHFFITRAEAERY